MRADTTRHPGGRPKATATPAVRVVGVPLPEDLRRRLFEDAHASDRTMGGMARAIIRAHYNGQPTASGEGSRG